MLMTIDKNLKIPDDSSAKVSSSSLLGGNYVEILPGNSDTYIKDNDTIFETTSAISFTDMIGKMIFK